MKEGKERLKKKQYQTIIYLSIIYFLNEDFNYNELKS